MLNPDDFRFPSIEALQAFEAAARLGTFERAAELLSITGSAASKRVSGLEGMLGVSLLQRDGRSLALTSTAASTSNRSRRSSPSSRRFRCIVARSSASSG